MSPSRNRTTKGWPNSPWLFRVAALVFAAASFTQLLAAGAGDRLSALHGALGLAMLCVALSQLVNASLIRQGHDQVTLWNGLGLARTPHLEERWRVTAALVLQILAVVIFVGGVIVTAVRR